MLSDRDTYAMLIDSDNVSPKYIDAIVGEMSAKYGDLNIKRIYGDWSQPSSKGWSAVMAAYSLKPVQQFRNTVGKNATDSTLIIDAMDILYTSDVDGFCIVSSDSDFTSLAQRLSEAGKVVIGMGEKKTPPSFRNACRQFVFLENIVDSDSDRTADGDHSTPEQSYSAGGRKDGGSRNSDADDSDNSDDKDSGLSRDAVRKAIEEIVRGNASRGQDTLLSDLGSRLISRYPDFDVRTFGYSQLSKFVASFDTFTLVPDGAPRFVELASYDSDTVRSYVLDMVEDFGDDGCALSTIGSALKEEFPKFSVKDAGYSKLKNFLRDIPGIVMVEDPSGQANLYPVGSGNQR